MRWRSLMPIAFVALASSLKLGPSTQLLEFNQTRHRRAAYPSCEAAVQDCATHFADLTRYPNIVTAFRGFDVVLGGVDVPARVDGFKSLIFDEAHERSGSVRFRNIAGHGSVICTKSVDVRIIKNVTQMFDSESSTTFESSSRQLGLEIGVSAGIGVTGTLSADFKNSATRAEARTRSMSGPINTGSGSLSQRQQASSSSGSGSGFSRSTGAQVGVAFTIPPIWNSLASSSDIKQNIATNLESKNVMTSEASTKCGKYNYRIQRYSPPEFHPAFKTALDHLKQCWNAADDANPNQKQCAKIFIQEYGTHFVKRATFGSKVTTTRILDFEKANSQSIQTLDHCTRSQETWSALGIYTEGETSSACQNDLSTGLKISQSGLQKEYTESAGCKPWVTAEDGPYPPVMIDKVLAPISDLFTSIMMTEERLGFAMDYSAIGTWLHDKILDYCVLFKSEHHCKHATRIRYSCAHCPGVIPLEYYTLGYYTGGLDNDFLPHTPSSVGVLDIKDSPHQIVARWEHGCPKDIQLKEGP